jgi:hypothetical protein
MTERPPTRPAKDPHPTTAAASGPAAGATAAGISLPGLVRAPAPIPVAVPLVADPGRLARRARVAAVLERAPAERLRSARADGRTRQGSLLVMPRIKGGHVRHLELLLESIAEPPDGEDFEINPVVPFLRLRTVHFARILLHHASPSEAAPIPSWNGAPQARGPAIPAKLLFSTDFDGPLDEHLDELLDVAGPGLDRIFQHCEGWPGRAERRLARDFLLRNRVPTSAFYTGTMGRSVDQIRREAELRDRIQAYLDRATGEPDFPADPLEIRERILGFVRAQPELAWAEVAPGPFPRLLIPQWFVNRLPLTGGLAVMAVLLVAFGALSLFLPAGRAALWVLVAAGAVGAIAAAGFAYLSRLAARDPVIVPADVKEHTARLVRTEDRIVQNEMSSVIYIKEPLWFRGAVLRLVMAFVGFAARFLSNQGTLAGIPSIHFARWVIVDGGRRLVFFSNFDGSWENYLGDFVDKAADGLTAVWSNCVGFPRTRGLWGRGATDEQRFKAYSRASQIPTQVWYSAYKWLSVPNINNNTRIRLGLYGGMSRAEAEAWLRRL